MNKAYKRKFSPQDTSKQEGPAPVSAAGLVAPESPWVMYLPEFYQDATIDFVKNEDGKWEEGVLVDVFSPMRKDFA